jgi:magnesium transporter
MIIQEGHGVVLEEDATPTPDWLDDDKIRWLIVEAATRDEIAEFFDRMGTDGTFLADYITGDPRSRWIEREQFTVTAKAVPTAWLEYETWFHLVALPQTIISVHGAEIPAMDEFIQRRWLDRPGPDAEMDAVLLKVIQSYVEEEIDEFGQIRLRVEQHAEGLRCGDKSFTVDHLEALMTKSNHMATVFFEYQRLCEGLGFVRSRVISLGSHEELIRRAAENIRSMRDGVEQLRGRLEELQRQHLMDRQIMTERRVRVLTILSAVFLPLTFVAGIYGMNFANMPELDEGYAYFLVLAGMGALAIGMVSFFFWKGWFR